ncbi:hypothetical protein [Streptomyces sp. NPDC005017]|uniref:hypothetical protein n=1 Tax=Streptomyces sp. NPDC005017 TaxID=3364706 RepID=UPI0036939CD4
MVTWLYYVRTARVPGFSLAEIGRHGEEVREAPGTAEALSAHAGRLCRKGLFPDRQATA